MRVRWAGHPERDQWLREQDGCGEIYRHIAVRFNAEFGTEATGPIIRRRMHLLGVSNGLCPKGRTVGRNGGWNRGTEAPWQYGCCTRGDVPVGSESRHGKLTRVKVAALPSAPKLQDHWRYKHILVWERAHGRPLPEGRKVVFADGDYSNFDPANLVDIDEMAAMIIKSHPTYYPYTDAETLRMQEARALMNSAANRADARLRDIRMGRA